MEIIYEDIKKSGNHYKVIFDGCYIIKKNDKTVYLSEEIEDISRVYQDMINNEKYMPVGLAEYK